jgi:exopolysaccharide biosynthesis polyprenyl glycosylphosphotransferase
MANGTSAQDALVESFTLEGPNGRDPKSSWVLRAPGGRWIQIAYVLMDVLLVSFVAAVVFYLRFAPDRSAVLSRLRLSGLREYLASGPYLGFLVVYLALIVLFCQSQHLYRTLRSRSPLAESYAVIKAVAMATFLLTAFLYLSGTTTISRLVVGFTGLLGAFALASWRLWKHEIVKQRVARGYGARNVLIVGAGRIGRALAQHLSENKQLGYVVKGFLDQNKNGDPRVLGRTEDLSKVALAHFIDEVFITIPSQRAVVASVTLEARRHRLGVKVVPELYDGLGWHAPIRYVGDFPIMELHWEPIPGPGLLVKRLLDVTLSLVGLIVLMPLFALIALAIKLDTPGPAIYRQKRIGKKGRIFDFYKFRTMVWNAEGLKERLLHLYERDGPFFKISEDPRVTRLGRFLRRYSLDELPQLWNVLTGDMSLVGPRPHPLDDFEKYGLEHLRRLDVKPGITGLWQVTARQDPSFTTNMALDLEYIENWNLIMDLKILVQTIPATLRGDGQ